MELKKGEHCGEFHGRTIQVEVAGHTTNRTCSSDVGLSNENTVFTSIKISRMLLIRAGEQMFVFIFLIYL